MSLYLSIVSFQFCVLLCDKTICCIYPGIWLLVWEWVNALCLYPLSFWECWTLREQFPWSFCGRRSRSNSWMVCIFWLCSLSIWPWIFWMRTPARRFPIILASAVVKCPYALDFSLKISPLFMLRELLPSLVFLMSWCYCCSELSSVHVFQVRENRNFK